MTTSPTAMHTLRLVLAGLALGLAGAAAQAKPGPPAVVLVTLDTTRADRLGCYGDATARTPTIDSLAARGTRFARALTASPLTLPAHASLMTGLIPPQHGLRDNGLQALPVDLPTLAEALGAAGYTTAAVVSSAVLDHRFGLDRGFDHYDDRLTAEIVGEYGYPERDARAVTDAALAWSEGLDDATPYFLWVHYYDPHSPYVDRGGGSGTGSPSELYGAEIAFVDSQLERLLDGLPGNGAERIVAVVGDHGEMLGEHGERAHGLLLYRASLEVPLVIAGPGVPSGRVVAETSATRALGATLVRLATGSVQEALGRPLPGFSSDPRSGSTPEPVYSETWLPATAYGWSPMLAVSLANWRYVQAPQPELFDYAADPAEVRNLIASEPQRAARLQAELGRFADLPAVEAAAPVEGGGELGAQLRALGYLSGATASDPNASDGEAIDPKDGIAWLDEFEEAKRLMNVGELWAARARFDALVRRNPGNVPFLTRAADARFATGDTVNGMALLERALEINPSFDLLHLRMADARLRTGDAAGAEASYRAAVDLNPRLAGAWLGLAQLAAMAGDTASEKARLEEAVSNGTISAGIFTRLGQLALAEGKGTLANDRLRRATELAPGLAAAWWSWGQAAERAGDSTAAIERYGRAVELNPRNSSARLHLGRLLVSLGRQVEARRMLEQAARVGAGSDVGREAERLLAGDLSDNGADPP